MAYPENQYSITETAKDLPTYTVESTDKILARQEDGKLGYIPVSDLLTTAGGDAIFSTVQATINGTGTNFKVGDDVYIGDINISNHMQVAGVQDITKGYIQFGSGSSMPTIGGSGANHLNIKNIPAYASNAAALSGGLVAGDIYRNGDNICITH